MKSSKATSKYNEPIPIKVVIVGPSGVGKTSISNRFVSDQLNPRPPATLGAVFLQKTIEHIPGKVIKFQIWDTAGQQKYRSIAKNYYQDAKIALLVYDVTNQQSFSGLQLWAQEVKNIAPSNVILALIGNKMDLLEEYSQEKKIQVNQAEAKQYAQSLGATFKIVSAKTSKGVSQLFSELSEKVQNTTNQENVKWQTRSVMVKQKQEQTKRRCCQ